MRQIFHQGIIQRAGIKQRLLRLLALGDVADDRKKIAEGSVRVSHHNPLHLSPHFFPGFGDIPFFRVVHGKFAAQQTPHLFDILVDVVRMGDVREGHLLQFRLGILQHGGEGRVPPDKMKRLIEHRHPGRAFLEHPPETLLALPQRLGYLIPLAYRTGRADTTR